MQLSKRNAEQIIQNINDILPHRLNLMDLHGMIIASTDQQRVGKFHGGAARIIRENLDELRIFSDDEYEGSRKGTNFLLRVNGEPIGVLGITGSYEEILPFASVIKRMTELLVNEKEYQKQREFFANRRTRFLMEWITHSEQVNKDFLNLGLELQVDLLIPRRILSIAFLPIEDGFDDNAVETTLESCLKKLDGNCLLCKATNEFLVFTRIQRDKDLREFATTLKEEIESRCKVSVMIGVDHPASDYLHMNEAYKQAKKALQSCLRTKTSAIRFYDEINMELFADEIPNQAKIRYLQKIFREYTAAEMKETVELLERFYENNGSIAKTAEDLFIHKNTLQQRLRKIFLRTGYDPRALSDNSVLYMAIYFYRDLYL